MLKALKRTFIIALSVAFHTITTSATLSIDDAKSVAADFFKSASVSRLASTDAFTLAHTVTSDDGSSNLVCYVFNARDGRGFAIVSAADGAMSVVGYSDSSIWTAAPEAADYVLATPVPAKTPGSKRAASRSVSTLSDAPASKLLTTPSWSQEAPFNNNVPNRRLTGCVGVALAEILKYHSYPLSRPAALVKDGEPAAYSWDAMRTDNHRSGYTADEAAAVATLVADAAVAIGTDFGMSSSSAFEVKVPYALSSLFGYDAGVSYKKRSELSKEAWEALIVNEINEGRPVLYSGQDVSSGHAFVCDGYEMRGGSYFFHINWGWGGSANGYFASDALNPVVSKAHSYNDLTTIVYNIRPAAAGAGEFSPIHITSDERQPGLTLDVTDITSAPSFTLRAGALKNIADANFSGSLAVALFDADGKQKCLLNDGRSFSLQGLQITRYVDFSCKLPAGASVAQDDKVGLVAKAAGSSAWLPVAGDLLAPGYAPAKGGSLAYFAVSIPASSADAEISAPAGNQVIKGRDFSFSVTPKTTDKIVTVKANGFILTPDASYGYRLANVTDNQTIDIIVQDAADALYRSTLWVEAGNLSSLLDERETSTVKDLTLFGTINASDFNFIRESLNLERLDISQVSIVAQGSNPANAIPAKALSGCRSLKSIILPASVNTFKNGCFSLTGLTSIEIPASVATYEYNIFVGCSALREVTVRRQAPAWINWCVFSGVPMTRLVVPVGASAAYKAKENWKDFKEVDEQEAVAPSLYKVTVAEKKGLKFSASAEGSEFAPGTDYTFTMEADDSQGDATMEVYANSTRLYPDDKGLYTARIASNTLLHAEFRQPEPTTVDKTWKISADAGGIGLVTDVVNVPVGKNFTVRVNAMKIPSGAEAAKFYAMVLTDRNGAIKEFISPVMTNISTTTGAQSCNFTCHVSNASVREGNELRLATSYNKKVWTLVEAEGEGVTDRLAAVGNKVIYHSINMPQSVEGAVITGAATQVVRGMPFSLRVSPEKYTHPIALFVNGVNVTKNGVKQGMAVANYTCPAVTEDLDIVIQVLEDAYEYPMEAVTVREGELAEKLSEFSSFPERLKVSGTMLVSDFEVFRQHAGVLIDLDLADVTIKGAAMTSNTIPSNAFVPAQSSTVSALASIILPVNLKRIAENAFARCTKLTSLSIPASVSFIGSGAFSSLSGLQKLTMTGTTAPSTGSLSPFPSQKITLEVPKGAENNYTTGFWADLNPKTAKQIFRIQLDPDRACKFNGMYNLDAIEVGSTNVQISVALPNCQHANGAGISRKGVLFKVYDNGRDIFSISNSSIKTNFIPNQYNNGGQYIVHFDPTYSSASYRYPQNHVLDIVFFYPINYDLSNAEGVTASLVDVPADNKATFNLSEFTYGATGTRQAFREGKDYKVRLTPPSERTLLSVKLESKVMTRPGISPVYTTSTTEIFPGEDGLYTIPSLAGDTRLIVSSSIRIEDGEPVASADLPAVNKVDAANIDNLAVTGTLSDASFRNIRDKFETVKSVNLLESENTSLPDGAFSGMHTLKDVIVSDAVTEIGAGCFKDCEGIESLTLPSVTSIGEGAFEGCSSLTSIILPSVGRTLSRSAEASVSAESFKGLNPNCIIYVGSTAIADADALNIILNRDGVREAASDIILDAAYPFNAPAGFNLGNHRISLTVDIPASDSAAISGGWRGIMLPFSPTAHVYGKEIPAREGSGLTLLSFDGADASALTSADKIVANRPYMAHVSAPYSSVPVTFYADAFEGREDGSFDVPFTPVAEETLAAGKDYTLYGSYDSYTRSGSVFTLNAQGDAFEPTDSVATLAPFSAYIIAADGVSAPLSIGQHPVWVRDPESTIAADSILSRADLITLDCLTPGAEIYYTLDGSDPADADNDARKLYEAPFAIPDDADAESLTVRAVAIVADYASDAVTYTYALAPMSGIATITSATYSVSVSAGSISLSGDLSAIASIAAYDLSGVCLASGTPDSPLSLNSGVVILVIRTTDGSTIRHKLLVK